MIYYDQNSSLAIQECGSRHSFQLDGQGIYLIPPACSLTFNGATFRNMDTTEINHHQQQQPSPILAFSDTAILENGLDFPDPRQSFITTKESMIAHALLLLLLAIISLATKFIHTYTFPPKAKSPNQNDPEAPPSIYMPDIRGYIHPLTLTHNGIPLPKMTQSSTNNTLLIHMSFTISVYQDHFFTTTIHAAEHNSPVICQ